MLPTVDSLQNTKIKNRQRKQTKTTEKQTKHKENTKTNKTTKSFLVYAAGRRVVAKKKNQNREGKQQKQKL